MTTPELDRFSKIIGQASSSCHRLVLIIGESGAGKTSLFTSLSLTYDLPLLNLGHQLGAKLMSVALRKRPLMIETTVQEFIGPGLGGVCIDNTDILFNPVLRCDPIRLACSVSQNRVILYSLNGRLEGRRFVRGYPDHPEYFSEEIPAIPTVFLERGAPTFYNS